MGRTSRRWLGVAAPTLALCLSAGVPGGAQPTAPAADVRFEVSGGVTAGEKEGLEVRVDLKNRGGQAASGVSVLGELAGGFDDVRLPGEVGPAQTRSLVLHFPSAPDRPGVHPVALRLDFTPANSPNASLSQCAYLLVTVGTSPPPAVRLTVAPLRLTDRDPLVVTVASTDGAPHRARVRALAPRGLTTDPPVVSVDVPASGEVTAALPILRGGAPRPSLQGVVVLAETDEGPDHRTAVATGLVDVAPDPARLPALRRPLAALALLLALVAGLAEAWRAVHRRPPRAPEPPPA